MRAIILRRGRFASGRRQRPPWFDLVIAQRYRAQTALTYPGPPNRRGMPGPYLPDFAATLVRARGAGRRQVFNPCEDILDFRAMQSPDKNSSRTIEAVTKSKYIHAAADELVVSSRP